MIDIYVAATGNAQRGVIALEECGLAYRAHRIDWANKPAEMLKIYPRGQVPVLLDANGPGGKPLVLAQSGAMLLHYATQTGRLIPTDPVRRAETFQWFMQATTDAAPTSGALFACANMLEPKAPQAAKLFEDRLLAHLRFADRRLTDRDYLIGELTIADLALFPVAHARADFIKAQGLTDLERWYGRLLARPTIQRALAACG